MVQELGKNAQQVQDLIPKPIIAKPTLDADLDAKVKELESKKLETLSKENPSIDI